MVSVSLNYIELTNGADAASAPHVFGFVPFFSCGFPFLEVVFFVPEVDPCLARSIWHADLLEAGCQIEQASANKF